jgi:hypothetical protein
MFFLVFKKWFVLLVVRLRVFSSSQKCTSTSTLLVPVLYVLVVVWTMIKRTNRSFTFRILLGKHPESRIQEKYQVVYGCVVPNKWFWHVYLYKTSYSVLYIIFSVPKICESYEYFLTIVGVSPQFKYGERIRRTLYQYEYSTESTIHKELPACEEINHARVFKRENEYSSTTGTGTIAGTSYRTVVMPVPVQVVPVSSVFIVIASVPYTSIPGTGTSTVHVMCNDWWYYYFTYGTSTGTPGVYFKLVYRYYKYRSTVLRIF